jgi:predicted Holliday junction resolvase-like endonuclease
MASLEDYLKAFERIANGEAKATYDVYLKLLESTADVLVKKDTIPIEDEIKRLEAELAKQISENNKLSEEFSDLKQHWQCKEYDRQRQLKREEDERQQQLKREEDERKAAEQTKRLEREQLEREEKEKKEKNKKSLMAILGGIAGGLVFFFLYHRIYFGTDVPVIVGFAISTGILGFIISFLGRFRANLANKDYAGGCAEGCGGGIGLSLSAAIAGGIIGVMFGVTGISFSLVGFTIVGVILGASIGYWEPWIFESKN